MAAYAIIGNGVMRLEDGASIPNDPGNSDWQAYLKFVAGGGVARPLQPGPQYDWNGTAWVVNAGRQAIIDASNQLGIDLSNVKASGPIVAFLQMSPAQIDAYITANVTSLPGAVAVLRILAKVVAVLARAQIAQ